MHAVPSKNNNDGIREDRARVNSTGGKFPNLVNPDYLPKVLLTYVPMRTLLCVSMTI